MKDFLSQKNNGKLWVEMIIVTVLDAIATVNVLTACNNDVKPVETRTVPHFAWLLNRRCVLRESRNSTSISRTAIFSLLCFPWNTTWHFLYPNNPKARAKMTGIVNTVYQKKNTKKGKIKQIKNHTHSWIQHLLENQGDDDRGKKIV